LPMRNNGEGGSVPERKEKISPAFPSHECKVELLQERHHLRGVMPLPCQLAERVAKSIEDRDARRVQRRDLVAGSASHAARNSAPGPPGRFGDRAMHPGVESAILR
jgi:hypothetical protein